MGNHEFCTGCGASDFHIGKTCEEAYPEKRKKVLERNAVAEEEQKVGAVILEKLVNQLKEHGIYSSLIRRQGLYSKIDNLDVTGYALARSEYEVEFVFKKKTT